MTDLPTGQLVGPGDGPDIGPRSALVTGAAGPPLYVRLAAEWLLSFDSAHTREAYRRDAGAYFAWCERFGINPLTAAPLHADGFRQYTAGELGKKASRARRLAAVSSFYRFARRRHPELGLDNPFDGVARPRPPRTSSTAGLSMEQAVTLFEHAERAGPRAEVIVQVLLATGMRVSELVGANTWDVRSAGERYTIAITRKGDRDDRLPLPPEAVAALREHVGSRRGPILVNRAGGRAVRQQVSRELTRLAAGAGLPPLTPHVLRHTAATLAILGGERIEVVQVLLGHADITTTMRYYHAVTGLENSAVYGLAAAYRCARRARAGLPAEVGGAVPQSGGERD